MHPKTGKYLAAISLNERIQFLKLLFCWKGSLWKLLWADFLWYFIAYIGVTLLYQFYLINDPVSKRRFEAIVTYMNKVSAIVPLSFLLGFFVSTVLGRWWTIVSTIPWMTKPAFTCQALITEGDREKCRNVRVTFIRYLNIAWVFAIMNLSQKIKDRFHVSDKTESQTKKSNLKNKNITVREKMEKINSDFMVKKYLGKLVMEEEIIVLEKNEKESNKPSYLLPLMWSTKLLERALKSGHLKSDSTCANLIGMVQTFGSSLESLNIYNQFNVPLVYTQVIVIVVYIFLLSEILSQQVISVSNTNALEVYFPIFAIFKFLIYMGWFKVGLCFINPFGNQQSDLPLDVILDYNLEVSASIPAAEDINFPEYLGDSFDESNGDRFDVFHKFKSFLPNKDNVVVDLEYNEKNTEMQKLSKGAA